MKWIKNTEENCYFEQDQNNSELWTYYSGNKIRIINHTQISIEYDENGNPIVVLLEIGKSDYFNKLTKGMAYHGKNLSFIEKKKEDFRGHWAKNAGI